jgi:fermentation-respiration switch protein FrsA (DUF1100 family)
MPKLFIHSREDRVVPYRLGRQLFDAASEPKRFYEVVGAGHNETWLVGGGGYFGALSDFIADATHRKNVRRFGSSGIYEVMGGLEPSPEGATYE